MPRRITGKLRTADLTRRERLYNYLFFASNFILEQEVEGDERETELAWTNAIANPIIHSVLMAGIELNWSGTTVKGQRGNPEVGSTIGRSLQWRPTNRTFLDVVTLFGTTPESPEAQLYFVFGHQFGLPDR